MRYLRLFGILLVVAIVALAVPAVFAGTATGGSPNDPLMVTGTSQTIQPNSSLWFYFDYTPSTGAPSFGGRFGRSPSGKPLANVTVDANGVGGLALAIYTPDQAKNWLNDQTTQPVGRGTPFVDVLSDTVTHDLYWSGGFNVAGRYFAVVTNNNSTPVSFMLTIEGDTVITTPLPTPTPEPTLFVPITVTPVPTGTIQGKFVFADAIGGTIYTVQGDSAKPVAVSHGIDPSWSPDGKQIVFARWDNAAPGVYVANADGSNEHIVFTSPRVRSPRMSPDGTQIVFSQQKKDWPNAVWKLGVVDLATGTLTEPQCSKLCYSPSWGPDGQTIYFNDPGIGVLATNKTSGAPWVVLGPNGMYWDTTKNAAMPIEHLPPTDSTMISPDGSRVAFMMAAQDHWDINYVSANGGSQIGVTQQDIMLYTFFNVRISSVSPTWSPDGKQILFMSDRTGKWQFYTINPDGTNLQQVLKNITDSVNINYGYQMERVVDWVKQ